MVSKSPLESDMDKVKPVTKLGVLANQVLCQLEAACTKSAHNKLVLRGLKIFMTFENEIKISRQKCCSQLQKFVMWSFQSICHARHMLLGLFQGRGCTA